MRDDVVFNFLAIFIMVLLVCGTYMYFQYYKAHYCDTPYEEVCVEHHIETRLVPVPAPASGGIGFKVGNHIRMVPRTIPVCDVYEYKLKPNCKENLDAI